jgi:CBS domain-containing membrane protein
MQATTPVSRIMTRKPAVVGLNDTMESVRKIFEKKGFHHIPVVHEGRLTGIVSYTDYLRLVREVFNNNDQEARENERILHAMLVKEVMTDHPYSIYEDTTVEDAMKILLKNEFHALPVVDGELRLQGIVTSNDLMKVLESIFAQESTEMENE